MFYAHFVLAKKGPLARIWLAAHWDKKLTKAHVYETNIESSVEGIMQPKVKMALRTSGHLLLGVVRIYSRKAKYLLADCNEAFVKIKMAFRPGMVDLPEDKREAAMNAITLPDVFHDFDTAMPDLDDVDINAQFSLNQTRAEEITMREDYGNITLTTGDDGFGDSMGQLEMEPRTPEMLRESSALHHEHFGSLGGEDINLDEETADLRKLREMSDAAAAGSSTFGGPTPIPTDNLQLDAPIQDDGFGGVGLVQDILSGGLFEGGSLFDDPVPGGTDSIRIPPSERTGFDDDDDFPGIPSPMHSDGSRPGTPIDNMSMNGDAIAPAPQLDATPIIPPSPAHSIASNHSYRANSVHGSVHGSVAGSVAGSVHGDKTPQHETTTLLHNEEESFALAPVEASALKGVRRQRKRKLIVDEIKAITGEGMKAQLSDSADIVTTLDIAPPTKRLMHWKETGGVDELFNLPGRRIRARIIITDYQNNLKAKSVADEHFDTLPGGDGDDLHLSNVGERDYDDEVMPSPRKRAAKRKLPDPPVKSAYAKRQEELARQQEEFAKQEKRVREEQEALQQQQSLAQDQEQERAADPNISLPAPEVSLPGQEPWATPGFSTNAPGFQTPAYDQGQSFGQIGNETPAYSNYAPSMGYPTPAHEPAYMTPAHAPAYQTPQHESSFPAPPASNLTPGEQASLTEQWVNQVQTDPSMMSPPHAPIMSPTHQAPTIPQEDTSPSKMSISSNQAQALDFGWDDQEQDKLPEPPKETEAAKLPEVEEEEESEEEDDYEEEDKSKKVVGEDDMQEDETIEEFEDRVLNKRAAQLHRHLSKKFSDRFSQMTRKNNRKQAAQKFHSLLVLQKMMALDVSQDSDTAYGEINIKKGPTWNTAAKSL